MDATEHERIGQRARRYRRSLGKSLDEVAGLAGISKPYLSMLESGKRRWDSRQLTSSVANALGVRLADLIGGPYPEGSPDEITARHQIQPLYEALISSSVEYGADADPRPFAELVALDDEVNRLYLEAGYKPMFRALPPLVLELHELQTRAISNRQEVLWRLLNLCRQASSALRAHGFLAHALLAAERCRDIAEELDEPLAVAWSIFPRQHALLPDGAYRVAHRSGLKALAMTSDSADGYPLEIRGAIALVTSFAAANDGGDADSLLSEAGDIADRTGESGTRAGNFGPSNVALHRMAISLERQNYDETIRLASIVDPATIRAATRRSTFYCDLGRAQAYLGDDRTALGSFSKAERLSAVNVRRNVFVRETVADMLDSARRVAGGPQLRNLAARLGVL